MSHFHANLREGFNDARIPARSLGTFKTREDAVTALLLAIGARITAGPGWVTRDAFLPLVGIGSVRIENVLDERSVTSSVWGCTCRTGDADLA